MRKILIGVGVLVVAVIAIVTFVFSSLDGLIQEAVEKYGTEITKAEVQLTVVNIDISSGKGSLSGLKVGNPKGFETPSAFNLGEISIAIDTGSVTKDPVIIKEIVITSPDITYELGSGGSNISAMTKAEVRRHAARFDLPVAEKPESQDICFVPDGNYASVIERLRPDAWEPGDIVDLDGKVLGRHGGIINFTVGQRRGLGIAAAHPLYVIKLDPQTRQVVAGPKQALQKHGLKVTRINWLGDGGEPPALSRPVVKIRSTTAAEPGLLRYAGNGHCEVTFEAPQSGVAPGQAAVFCDGERVLGGGWIERDD